ncbi:MAG: helix-turn-helix transcriptional regulator [Desulfobacterales bacterium]|uniref:Helix-turn-helix transcriptional regulator n=1 Tax=Candidatus Desulfatibia vada TaxID=2841696 RepID=A0A8J6TKG1_9BACT|nr:helix-turn-helix transcriptional regulator [Candidatus Desulfatibia vada]MBL6971945.1 helix-turn-helix transcriptional regulator [Desulfobacterales bacterium]
MFVQNVFYFCNLCTNVSFWSGYDERPETFKLGILLKQARLEAGLIQEQIAKRLKTTKSVVSHMGNHATDIRLSTYEKFAKAVGRKIHVTLR